MPDLRRTFPLCAAGGGATSTLRRIGPWACVAALLAGCQTSDKAASTTCPVAIEFASYCCGPDIRAEKLLEAVLKSPEFRKVRTDIYPWGIEGETTWCISPGASRDALLARLRTSLPTTGPNKDIPPPVVQLNWDVSVHHQGRLKGPNRLR